MSEKLKDIQAKSGAIFEGDVTVPISYGDDRASLTATKEGVALCDRSHWGLLEISGDDRKRFLHNQTTNDINSLQPGRGCDTVFVTSTGRNIDLATAYVTEDIVLVLVSPNRRQQLMEWMDRYIFPMDRVELADKSDRYAVFSLIGPKCGDLLQQLGATEILGQPEATHLLLKIGNIEVRVGVGSGLGIDGYTLIVPVESAAEIWSKLIELEAIPMGDRLWEELRILQGRPASDRELTEEYNPLEAGLWKAISFEKGCYIGQETIARLNTYKGVKQRLWGVLLTSTVEPGTPVTVEDKKVGTITSCIESDGKPFGLAYIRTKTGGAGLKVRVGESSAELIGVPFLSHEYYEPKK